MLQEIYNTLKQRQGKPILANNVGVKSEILNYLRNDPTLSAKELATLLNKSTRTIERNLKELRELGLVKRMGADKSGIWKVL